MSEDEAPVMRTWETVCEFLEELPGAERDPPGGREVDRVIVRLATVQPDRLRELLIEAWRLVAPKRLVRELDSP
jgi:hypothetical protein